MDIGLVEHALQMVAGGADADGQGLCGALLVVAARQQVGDGGLARRQAEGIFSRSEKAGSARTAEVEIAAALAGLWQPIHALTRLIP